MKILRSIRSVNPAVGGPVEGVKQVSRVMEDMGHQVEIVSLDAPHDPWVAEFPFRVHAMGPVGGKYGYSARLVPWLREHAPRYDAVIVHGLWQYSSFGVWRALRDLPVPYFVYAHGMLDPWFKQAYPLKHLKKWLYWPWAEYRVLRDAKAVFFTSEEERSKAGRSFWLSRWNDMVVNYGTAKPMGDAAAQRQTFLARHPELAGKRVLLYLGRIHEKKGCDLLIQAFARVAGSDPALHLVMAGPDQTGWQRELQALGERLGIAQRITWTGMLSGDLKWGAYHAADAFVLPSHQENFGIVVAEALACGLPVLISNKVDIWREIEGAGAGLVANDTLDGTADLLARWLALPPQGRAEMRQRAKACFQQHFDIENAARHLIDLFQRGGVLGGTGAKVRGAA
ncbi:glycosyltransferase [Thermithiobacillus tepidarius DSM 3134]|uniref:glycosyltransferase n=1 Tax=Thermithiobacillus tepidarius TaxID=929 RepID=UPI0006881160